VPKDSGQLIYKRLLYAMGNEPGDIQREGELGAIFRRRAKRLKWKSHRFGNTTATDRLHLRTSGYQNPVDTIPLLRKPYISISTTENDLFMLFCHWRGR